jgi:hypothetical protein
MNEPTAGSSWLDRIQAEASLDWPRYRIFGMTFASDYAFEKYLPAGEGYPDLLFTLVNSRPACSSWEALEPTYVSPYLNPAGDNFLSLYTTSGCWVIRYAGIADFYLLDRGIICHILDPDQQDLAAVHILPAVLSVWLELNKRVFALHASAVVVGRQVIAFLGHSGHGKSTLAAAFAQADYPLLSDDILLVDDRNGEFVARPGYPFMRLWPDEAEWFYGGYKEFENIQAGYGKLRVPLSADHFGKFYDRAAPLTRIYLPQRRPASDGSAIIRFTSISPQEVVIELMRFAYSSRLSEALGRNAERLDFFARLAGKVPLRRLAIPNGYEHLPAVLSALLVDLSDQS